MKNIKWIAKSTMLAALLFAVTGCTSDKINTPIENSADTQIEIAKDSPVETVKDSPVEDAVNEVKKDGVHSANLGEPDTVNYKLIKVDGGDTNGYREPNVVVNVGHGNREYWAYTNEHGQLVRVTAKKIVLQNDKTEEVNSSGRYYNKMADVPGVGEKYGMDRGHVIADSLGGVSNAYNITPQDATLNRHGDQAYMEKVIRQAGGATNFDARITYPNTQTQTPSNYSITYTVKGNTVTDSFANGNPDKTNKDLGITKSITNAKPSESPKVNSVGNVNDNIKEGDLNAVDSNGNGRVTIQEAKDAGFTMPIRDTHWLYQYMTDSNSNGMVGE